MQTKNNIIKFPTRGTAAERNLSAMHRTMALTLLLEALETNALNSDLCLQCPDGTIITLQDSAQCLHHLIKMHTPTQNRSCREKNQWYRFWNGDLVNP